MLRIDTIFLGASIVASYSSEGVFALTTTPGLPHTRLQTLRMPPTSLSVPIPPSHAASKGSQRLITCDTSIRSSLGSSPSENGHENTNERSTDTRKSKSTSSTRILSILAILAATTLNLLGFTLTSPLNPTLGAHFNLPTGASFGSLTSAYPAGMLLGQLTWPRLSDFLGRKRIMAISLLGSGVGLSLQSLALWKEWSLGIFLATRVFTGLFSGIAPVAKAFLADIGDADAKEKNEKGLVAKYLGWRDAASTLSYILGPAIGGLLYESIKKKNSAAKLDVSMRWLNQGRPLGGGATRTAGAAATAMDGGRSKALAVVIGMSALGSLLAAFLVMTVVKDIKTMNVHDPTKKTDANAINHDGKQDSLKTQMDESAKVDYEIVACPLGKSLWSGVATVCIVSFLYHVADSTFFAFYPALLQNQLNLDARAIGMSFTGFACISFLFSATSLSSKLIERVGVVNTCVAGLGAIGAGLAALSASASGIVGNSCLGMGVMKNLTFGAAALYFSGVPLYGPTIPTMLLLCVPPYQRGAVMGVDGVINTMARIVSPLIMGDIYRRSGAAMTFRLASAAVFSSSAITMLRRFLVVRGQRKMAAETR